MNLDSLLTISPIDGRYREKLEELASYFSEFALIKYRIKIEVLYLIKLADFGIIRKLTSKEKDYLVSLFKKFSLEDANRVKEIEKVINHDVKAVEYFIREKLQETPLVDLEEFVHFALTSEDTSNLAYSLLIQQCLQKLYFPTLESLIEDLTHFAKQHKRIAMLGHTHGQPASPTTLGKELAVFVYRLKVQIKSFPQLTGKLNGAVGNYNAHVIALPQVDWVKFSQNFIKTLDLEPNLITTQIESHDIWAQLFQAMMRINNILIGLNRDIWTYISFDYLKQKSIKEEVGSSTMPHKINPIDFENSEGNLGMANSALEHLATKLPISRLQRDLTDSTVSRNIGLAFSYCLLAYGGLRKGLQKVEVNQEAINQDLESHPEVITEAIQMILRREKVPLPYEDLKNLTRGKKFSRRKLESFIEHLKIPSKIKKELKSIRAESYLGLAGKLTEIALQYH